MRSSNEPCFGSNLGGNRRAERARRPMSAMASSLISFALVACAMEPEEQVVTAVQFQDVVVPSGLRLRDEAARSWSREDASWRHGHFEYTGQVDVQTAADYVRARMLQHNWTKTQDKTVADVGLSMQFEREIYQAVYTFSRSEGVTVMVVEYTTNITRR
jgi:hypothetical protein